jgi:predicted DNA-binding transcriptional regulator AlpA
VQEIYISFRELRQHGIQYCRLHVNRLVERGVFPAPVWFSSNRKLWRMSEIENWLATRGTARPAMQAADAA